MPTVLAVDLSTSRTGLALLSEESGWKLVKYDAVEHDGVISSYGPYPFSYVTALSLMAERVVDCIIQMTDTVGPDTIVIEETNGSKNRYTQKALEMLHCLFLQRLQRLGYSSDRVKYVSTGVWRRAVGIELTKEQKRQNARLSKAKRAAKIRGEKLDKKALGIAGKVSKKHVAVAWANEHFGLSLKQKDNDIADAIGIGVAFTQGAPVCDGK